MSRDRSDEIARRAAAARFRRGRASMASDLTRLLGPRAGAALLEDRERAVALNADFLRTHTEAAKHDWARISQWWDASEAGDLANALHRLARNAGARPVWLIVLGREPQAAVTDSDSVLDNPLGFAALGDYELRLLDCEVPAGLWLVRHSYHAGAGVAYRWEFEVWGAEPWLSAATRALRGED
jgi:hypothetical protein